MHVSLHLHFNIIFWTTTIPEELNVSIFSHVDGYSVFGTR
jgi:hypothetical protein